VIDLDHEACLDPVRVGAKAAWLAKARRAGLPTQPGFVIEAAESRRHMRLGAETMATRGSGGARLAVTAEPVRFVDTLVGRAGRLAGRLVARSSTSLEATGEFSGAFASYLDLAPEELPRAVAGCWASAFSVAVLQRLEAAGIEPGSFPMAVLVQPALDPLAGGVARIDDDGNVSVVGVKGSPAPLLQGWSTGSEARADPDGGWAGEELIELVGREHLDALAEIMRAALRSVGANRCEWALDRDIRILQLGFGRPPATPAYAFGADLTRPELAAVARAAMLVPGRLGEELVMPWALGGLPDPGEAVPESHGMGHAIELRDLLVAEVWQKPAGAALAEARACLTALFGPDPRVAIDRIGTLSKPDPGRSALLLALVGRMGDLEKDASRQGVGRWEPFVASVTLSVGSIRTGAPAAPGIGAGVGVAVGRPSQVGSFSPRGVITSTRPIPFLAPLLWDAAGIVTETGSPAAHLFEAARALGVPAVCGVALPPGDHIVAVDGSSGTVATLPLRGGEDD
jgi:hypothetical protein